MNQQDFFIQKVQMILQISFFCFSLSKILYLDQEQFDKAPPHLEMYTASG